MSWLDAYFIGLTTIQSNGVPLPQVPTINFGANVTAVYNQAQNRIDVSATGGGGGGNTPIPRFTVTGTATVATPYAIHDIDCSGGNVLLTIPVAAEGIWFGVFFKSGNLGTNKCTLQGASGKTIQHVNGPISPSNPSGTTMQDAYTNTVVYDSTGFDQSSLTLISDASGNYDIH
jgi:hypothetical protein